MRLFSFLVFFVLIHTSNFSFANELNGSLDYIVRTDDGTVKLIITNKKPDTPAQLSGVTIVFPDKKQLPIAISLGQPIDQNIIVNLGSVSTLVGYIVPRTNMSALKSVIATDCDSCENLEITGFGLLINVDYGPYYKQPTNLVPVFLYTNKGT